MNATDRYVDANGLRLHYLDHPGDGPLIVLMPGLTANAHCFDGLVQHGLSPRFRVLALDMRGRGDSDKPPTGYGVADHAADVIGLLDRLGLQRVILGGHSFGGLLTFYLAAHYPERFERLIIFDAAAALGSPATRAAIQPAIDRLGRVLPSWEAYLAMMKQAPYYNGWWDPTVESYYRADVQTNPDGTIQPRSRPDTIAAVSDGVIAEDWMRHIAAIRQPVILFRGIDPYGPPGAPPLLSAEQARPTVAALANCRYLEVPGNHMTMLYGEGARQIADGIASFVQ